MANKYAGPVQGKVRLVMDAPGGDGAEVKLARVMLDANTPEALRKDAIRVLADLAGN